MNIIISPAETELSWALERLRLAASFVTFSALLPLMEPTGFIRAWSSCLGWAGWRVRVQPCEYSFGARRWRPRWRSQVRGIVIRGKKKCERAGKLLEEAEASRFSFSKSWKFGVGQKSSSRSLLEDGRLWLGRWNFFPEQMGQN